MTMEDEIEQERIECLVQQGFTPSLAHNVILARSREYLPLTIWIVDNSSSMNERDGRKIVSTKSQDHVRFETCSRWEELKETVMYHAQLAALLDAPTRFLMLNRPTSAPQPRTDISLFASLFQTNHQRAQKTDSIQTCPQEMSIAERGSEWTEEDMDQFVQQFSKVSPMGATPLTGHLERIYLSLEHHTEAKIVLVLATDGKPTDERGFISSSVDRAFEHALKQLQSRAWIVIRLCTNDDSILQYYQKLDEEMELSLEVLDDFTDEAKEVHQHNPWLTYSLGLHRCREMGMSIHSTFRFLDWLDERPLERSEIGEVLKRTFGVIDGAGDNDSIIRKSSQSEEGWSNLCALVQREQEILTQQRKKNNGDELKAFFPWNPIRKRTTHWVDIRKLRRHKRKASFYIDYVLMIFWTFCSWLASFFYAKPALKKE